MEQAVGRRMGRRGMLGAAAAAASGIAPGRARAQGSAGGGAAGLAALLVDLPGCTGAAPETMSLTQGSLAYRWASRSYERGEARFNVMLGVTPAGSAPVVPGAESGQDVDMKAGPHLYRAGTVRGFRVMQSYNEEDRTGGVVVALGPSGEAGTLVAQFEGMTLEDALALLARFDWAAMRTQAAAR